MMSDRDLVPKCDQSDKTFTRFTSLRTHKRALNKTKRPFQCDDCDRQFKYKRYLQSPHSGVKPRKSKTRGRGFRKQHQLRQNMLFHSGGKPQNSGIQQFKCIKCDRAFRALSHLQKHMLNHSCEITFKCDKCNKTFTTSRNLRSHKTNHCAEKSLKCKECDRIFTTQSRLQEHVLQLHHNGEMPHLCVTCFKAYATHEELQSHMETEHTGEQHALACGLCYQKSVHTASINNFMIANNERQSYTESKPYVCGHCNGSFREEASLEQHIEAHMDNPFQCIGCLQCSIHLDCSQKDGTIPKTVPATQQIQSIRDDDTCTSASANISDIISTTPESASAPEHSGIEVNKDGRRYSEAEEEMEEVDDRDNDPDYTCEESDIESYSEAEEEMEEVDERDNDTDYTCEESEILSNETSSQEHVETSPSQVTVLTTTSSRDGKRICDKRHCCVFCGKFPAKIARHLQVHHKQEDEIILLTGLPDAEKWKVLDKLRLDGDYKHNMTVLRQNKGQLIPQKRPQTRDAEKYSFSDFFPCQYCKGFYIKYDLWRHRKTCSFSPANDDSKTKKCYGPQRRVVKLSQTTNPDNEKICKTKNASQHCLGSVGTVSASENDADQRYVDTEVTDADSGNVPGRTCKETEGSDVISNETSSQVNAESASAKENWNVKWKEDGTEIYEPIVTLPSSTFKDGKRVFDKRHQCIFCGKPQLKIARHLQETHKNEEEILRLATLTSAEKSKVLNKLRLEGDYKHNMNVLSQNKGELILQRRIRAKYRERYSSDDFVTCEYCKGFYVKRELWRHKERCQFAPAKNVSKGKEQPQELQNMVIELSLPENEIQSSETSSQEHAETTSVKVPLIPTGEGGKRLFNKKHSCIFCGKLQLKIARHLQMKHKNEDEILRLATLTPAEKSKVLDKLRLEGDYKHNISALIQNKGQLILPKRLSRTDKKYSVNDYVTCQYCKGFYPKRELWRHRKTCQFTPRNNDSKKKERPRSRPQMKWVKRLQSSLPENEDVNNTFMEHVMMDLNEGEVEWLSNHLQDGQSINANTGLYPNQEESNTLGELTKGHKTSGNGTTLTGDEEQEHGSSVNPSQSTSQENTCVDFEESGNNSGAEVTLPSTTFKDGKRVCDKRHHCVFCGKPQLKIARHLQGKHKNEDEILRLATLSPVEKSKVLDKLRLEGNYKHNMNVLSQNKGQLVLARRILTKYRERYSLDDFVTCEYCKGYYVKHELWRHKNKCQFAKTKNISKGKEQSQQEQQEMVIQTSLPEIEILSNETSLREHAETTSVKRPTTKEVCIYKRPRKTKMKDMIKMKVPWSEIETEALERQFKRHRCSLTLPTQEECEMAREVEPALKNRTWKNIKYRVYYDVMRLRKNVD